MTHLGMLGTLAAAKEASVERAGSCKDGALDRRWIGYCATGMEGRELADAGREMS